MSREINQLKQHTMVTFQDDSIVLYQLTSFVVPLHVHEGNKHLTPPTVSTCRS